MSMISCAGCRTRAEEVSAINRGWRVCQRCNYPLCEVCRTGNHCPSHQCRSITNNALQTRAYVETVLGAMLGNTNATAAANLRARVPNTFSRAWQWLISRNDLWFKLSTATMIIVLILYVFLPQKAKVNALPKNPLKKEIDTINPVTNFIQKPVTTEKEALKENEQKPKIYLQQRVEEEFGKKTEIHISPTDEEIKQLIFTKESKHGNSK